MKWFFCVIILLLTVKSVSAQDQTDVIAPVFELEDVDQAPEFPGGIENCYAFFYKNFKKPEVPELVGKIFITFIVETDGTLTDIQSRRNPGFGTGAEAERIMQLSPKWIPGKKGGQRVRVHYTLPIGIHTD